MRSDKFWKWFDGFAAPKLDGWPGMRRGTTFRKMFEHLETFDRPVHILETGCIEGATEASWAGNGCSTILFNEFQDLHRGSTVTSVELMQHKITQAKQLCPNVNFYRGDSAEVLANLAKTLNRPIDLLFLDASHHYWTFETPSQVHHYNELMAIIPLLHERTLVVVDDTRHVVDDYPLTRAIGKGGIVAAYALEIGAVMEFCDYQIGFTKMTRKRPVDHDGNTIEATMEELITDARKLVEEGRVDAADRIYRVILANTPQPWTGRVRVARGEAYANYGRTAHKIRNYGKAIDWYRLALNSDPLATEYRCDLARSLVALGAMESAKRECTIASEIEPENPSVWATFGGVESDMMNEPGAIFAYDKQVETAKKLNPPNALVLSDAILNRAVIALDGKDYDLARKCAAEIIALKAREGDAWHVLAILEYRLSNHEQSIEYFDKALAHDCRNKPLTHWNRSLPLQSIGRFKEAFSEHAWGRQELTVTAIYVPHRRFTVPHWEGQQNCTVHVHTEAGHGDNIQLLRYLPLFKKHGCIVRYECDPQLLSLAQRSMPDIEMMPRAKDYPSAIGIKGFDYHLPMGDLPYAFDTDINTVPWNGPYLKADPALVAEIAKELPKGKKIGLCWSSGIRVDMNIWMEKYGRMKSMYFEDMEPLLEADANFISLQVGDRREDMRGNIQDVLSEKPTWDETAALIANLDLVITVDTGVAHLAGAMGKPTWVVMQRDGASWHFLCERPGASWNERNPWYPSIRVFRQSDGTWASAIEKVRKALDGF